MACRNAMAGLMILQGYVEQAANLYKETLSNCTKWENSLSVHTDVVQLIHCSYNLLCCEELSPGVLDPSTIDGVRNKLRDLENEFIAKPRENLDRSISHKNSIEIPDVLIDTTFQMIHVISVGLNEGQPIEEEPFLPLQSDYDVASLFTFADYIANLVPQDKSVKMFMRALRVVIYSV